MGKELDGTFLSDTFEIIQEIDISVPGSSITTDPILYNTLLFSRG